MKSGRLDGFPGFQLPMSDCRQLSSAESHFQLLLQTSKILRRRRGIVRDISEMPGCFNVSAILSNCFTMFLVSTLLRGRVLSSFFSSSVCLSSLCLLAGFWGGGGGMLTFSCTSTHTPCYAAAHSLALPRIRHATLLHVLLHFHTYVMLRARTAFFADGCKAWKGASNQQVPEKRLKWQNFAHNRGEFVKHLGGSPQKRVLLWPEHRL